MGLEMISLKSPREIEAMRRAGRLTAQARALAGSMIRPGVTTHEIDTAVRRFIESHGAKPSFLGYGGFPGSACISVNEEVIHGIPGPRKLKEGDIVSVDVAGLGLILLKQVLFFVAAAVVVVWVAPALMTLAGVLKAPSGIAVMAVIICLAMAWASNLAGLSYAVGAFFAGIAVSNSDYAEDADRYIEPVGDTLFVPVFFVGIGLQTTGVDDTKMIVFIAIMTVLGVITKVVGCGLGGRMAGFGGASALMIGAGMVPRGEMALITAQIGFNEHVLGSEYYSTIIFIISLVTLVAPLLLKLTIRKVPGVGAGAAGTAGAEQ